MSQDEQEKHYEVAECRLHQCRYFWEAGCIDNAGTIFSEVRTGLRSAGVISGVASLIFQR